MKVRRELENVFTFHRGIIERISARKRNVVAETSKQHHFAPSNFTSYIAECGICHTNIEMIISEDEDGNLIVNGDVLRCLYCNICYHKNCHSNDNECHAEILQLRYQKDNIVEHQVQSGSLKDFCSNKNHMIPSLLVNCVNALDKNRLDFQGIYRIPGQGSQVQKLLKELKGSKEIVNLDEYATETITGCIKAFLKEIRDPLIPPYLFEDFYQACDSELDFKIHDAILKLPKPHQDTLIYMFGHWNRVVTNSEKNLMTLENLAYCLAPTAVGIYMEKDIKIDAVREEIKKQIKIMMRLLSMPQKYWQHFIENSQEGQKS